MKNIAKMICISVLLLCGLCSAQSAPMPYKQTQTFNVGGDGFWDYITYDSAANRLFMAHGSEIDVIDAGSGQKRGASPADGAHGIALVQDKGLGFSTNGRAGTVTVFDLKSLQPKQEIKAGENPDAIIYDRYSRKVIVMNGRSKDVMVIDPATLKVIATIPLGGKLEYAAADRAHVYVNVEDTSEIASLDSKTWKAVARWKLTGCEEPSGLAIDERLHHLFSVCGNSKMMVVDTVNGQVVSTLDTGAGTDGAAFDPGLGYALCSNGRDATLTVMHRSSKGKYEVLANVPTEPGARTITLDPKTHRVFLPTAELGPPADGQRRPRIKPGSFKVLVFAPAR